jgi:hypothetical protein
MARKVGQIIRRGARTWVVRVYNGRDPETKKRKYLNQTVKGGLPGAQAVLNKMLGERDRGRNLESSKQTLNEFLDRWLQVCAQLFGRSLRNVYVRNRQTVPKHPGRKGVPAGCVSTQSRVASPWITPTGSAKAHTATIETVFIHITTSTASERHATLLKGRAQLASAGAWITDFRQFSNVSVCIGFEIDGQFVSTIESSLEKAGIAISRSSLAELRQSATTARASTIVNGTVQITFFHSEPDLKTEIPAVPG